LTGLAVEPEAPGLAEAAAFEIEPVLDHLLRGHQDLRLIGVVAPDTLGVQHLVAGHDAHVVAGDVDRRDQLLDLVQARDADHHADIAVPLGDAQEPIDEMDDRLRLADARIEARQEELRLGLAGRHLLQMDGQIGHGVPHGA
jgi:hypothetical protein